MKIFIGKVISKKMQKTVTVAVQRTLKHPLYKKRFTRVKKYHVHDDFDVEVGQTVRFVASRPYSKMVKWAILPTKEEKKTATDAGKIKKAISKPKAVRKETKK